MTENAKSWTSYMKPIGAIIGVIVAVWISLITPPDPLTVSSMRFLGIFVCAVIWLVVAVIPDFMVIVVTLIALTAVKVAPLTTIFSAFSSDTCFLLIGALGIGAGVEKSGLLNRIVLGIMNKFPGTFRGMTTAIFVAANVINPMIPSVTAKVTIFAVFIKAIGEKLGYENGSKGMLGMFMAMFLSAGTIYPFFLSATFLTYTLLGMLPAEAAADITWMKWLSYTIVWGIVLMILLYLVVQIFFKPQEEKVMDKSYFQDQLTALGPMTKMEKYILVLLAVALIGWMTERLHGVSAGMTAMFVLACMVGLNVLTRDDFRAKITWDAIVLMMGIIGLAGLFSALGVSTWLVRLVGPFMGPIVSNPYLLVFVTCVVIFLIRFILISQTASLAVFVSLLVPIAANFGIHPFVIGFIVITAVNTWAVYYQNTSYLAAYYAAGGMITHSQATKGSLFYTAANIIGLLASVPLWKMFGLIP